MRDMYCDRVCGEDARYEKDRYCEKICDSVLRG